MEVSSCRLRASAARCAALETELAAGGHEHRKFVEIANRQAARDGTIATELEAGRRATDRLKGAIARRDAEMADLASQLLAARTQVADSVQETPRKPGVFGLWRPLSRSDSSRFGSFLDR